MLHNEYQTITLDVVDIREGIILHGVNCQGVMGSGIAGALARKWPAVRNEYLKFVDAERERHGSQFVSSKLLGMTQAVHVSTHVPRITVYNCFTQDYYGGDGQRYACPIAIRHVLTKLFDEFDMLVQDLYDFCSLPPNDSTTVDTFVEASSQIVNRAYHVYMPQIGCGLGGLSWTDDVKPIVDELYVDRKFKLSIITL